MNLDDRRIRKIYTSDDRILSIYRNKSRKIILKYDNRMEVIDKNDKNIWFLFSTIGGDYNEFNQVLGLGIVMKGNSNILIFDYHDVYWKNQREIKGVK